jgi:hypothetical protein
VRFHLYRAGNPSMFMNRMALCFHASEFLLSNIIRVAV